jgi:Zn-dependent M16 (insulinase) family peptidase
MEWFLGRLALWHLLVAYLATSGVYWVWCPWEDPAAPGGGVVLHDNYSFLDYVYVAEYDLHCSRYRHLRTGAEVMSVRAADTNKVFGISFRTPPPDSTGVAHVMEHSVLCGSDRFRTKEPFVDLLRSSLQTFLNAMTYPDRTVYPVASQNDKDFYNLVDVYLDVSVESSDARVLR